MEDMIWGVRLTEEEAKRFAAIVERYKARNRAQAFRWMLAHIYNTWPQLKNSISPAEEDLQNE